MAEEYVYKIVIDDGDVNKTIDSIDQRVVALTQRMDAAFKKVGTGTGTGPQKVAQQVEQAAKKVQAAEQQKAQQIVRGQQQIDQARRKSLAVVDQELKVANSRLSKAKDNSAQIKRVIDSETQYLEEALEDRKKAQEDAASTATGAKGAVQRDLGEMGIRTSQRRVDRFEGTLASRGQELSAANEEVAAAQQAYDKIAQSRQELLNKTTQAAQQQQQVETQAARQTAQVVTQTQQRTQKQVEASRRRNLRTINQELAQSKQKMNLANQSARVVKTSLDQQEKELREVLALRREENKLLEQKKTQAAAIPGAITSKAKADDFYKFLTDRPDITNIQGKELTRLADDRVVGIGRDRTGQPAAPDVDSIYRNRRENNDFLSGMRARAAADIAQQEAVVGGLETTAGGLVTQRGETRGQAGEAQAEVAAAQQAHAQIAQSRQELLNQATQAAQQQRQIETEAAEQTAQTVVQAQQQQAQAAQQQAAAEAQLAAVSQQSGQARVQAANSAVQASQNVVQSRQAELASAQQAANSASAEASNAQRVAELKKRAYEDAKEAARSAAEAVKSASADEKESAKQAAEAKKEEAEVAKVASTEATRTAEDATKKATAANQQRAAISKQATAATRLQGRAEKELAKSTGLLAKEKRQAATAERNAAKEFVRTTKTFTKQRNELNALAEKHGSFNVVLGKSRREMNGLEKEVDDVIRSDKKLATEVDRLIAKHKKLNVEVNRTTFRGGPSQGIQSQQFRQAGFAAQRVGIPGAAALGEAAAVAGPAGVAIAATLLAGQQLIKMFLKLAGVAKEAFEAIVRGSIDAAKEIEIARAQFGAFFQGDTIAAEAALQRLQKLSRELGENVVGVGRAFLPEVENLDQLEQITELAVALARFQPEQGILGARIALQEALAGETRSLQRRFEINPVAIDQIREAFEVGGVTGLLNELQNELERTGRSVEDLSDTFSVSVGKIQQRWTQFLQTLGEPIITELKEQLSDIDRELQVLSPDLEKVAAAFGEVVSLLAEMIGQEVESFLHEFDAAPLFEVADALFGVVYAFETWLIGINAGESLAAGLENTLYDLAGSLLKVEEFFLNTALAMAEYKEQMKDVLPLVEALNDLGEEAIKLPAKAPIIGNVPGVGPLTGAVSGVFGGLHAFQEGFLSGGGSVEEVEQRIADLEERKGEFSEGIRDFGLDSTIDQGEKAANVFLEMASALDELIVMQKDYEKVQLKVNEAVSEFNIQAQLKFEKILTDATRKRLEFEIQAAQKTIDIERKNAQKVSDIRSSYDQNILGAAVDLTDKEADILRKHSDNVLDLEDDLNDKRIKEEEKYQEELERIKDRFNFQAFEAILANDGKKLRQIRRQQAFEEQQAKKNRDKGLDGIDDEIEDRRKKLDIALEREIRDARIANARKIRDLATSLDEQLEKQKEARRRDLESQAISERRKRQELTDSLNQQLDDYRTWWDERNRVTQDKIADDLDALREYVASAADILNELRALGIVFDPVTGQPQMSVAQPSISDPSTPSIEAMRELVVTLQKADEMVRFGRTRPEETITAEVAALSVERLIERLDELQTELDIAETAPDLFVETTNLAAGLLFEQALNLGSQVGLGAEEIIDEILGMSMKDLSKWIDEFIARYSVHELPEFSIFGSEFAAESGEGGPTTLTESVLAGVAMLTDIIGSGGIPFAGGEQPVTTQATGGLPFSQLSAAEQAAAIAAAQEEGGAGLVHGVPIVQYSTTATPQLGQASQPQTGTQPFFPAPNLGAPAAAAPTGPATYVFPSVIAPPYPTQDDAPVGQFVPSFNQAIDAPPFLTNAVLQPGSVLAGDPSTGFDAETFTAQIDSQVAEFIVAEMVKRGEISDTIAFAELMVEKQTLGVNALLGSQVDEYQIMSDAQIAILEDTLVRQQAALDKLRKDPELEEEVKVTELAIAQLEEVIERQRALAAEANIAALEQEASFVEDVEEDKQIAIGDTLTVAGQAAEDKVRVVTRGLDDELTAAQDAALEEAGIITAEEAEKGRIRAEGREAELEAEDDHSEVRMDQLEEGFGGEISLLSSAWEDWITIEGQGVSQDLRLLAEWIDQRNILINQAATTLPGQLPGDDPEDPDGDSGGFQASLGELQSLATDLAEEYGLGPAAIGDIRHMSYDELIGFIDWLQVELANRFLGGSLQPGQMSLVGEQGPEIVTSMGGAQVYPLRDLLFRTPPMADAAGGTTTTYTQEVTNTFPDPRGIPQTYIRMMENIAARVNKQSWSGR